MYVCGWVWGGGGGGLGVSSAYIEDVFLAYDVLSTTRFVQN